MAIMNGNASLVIDYCKFSLGSGDNGGALWLEAGAASLTKINNTRFEENYATYKVHGREFTSELYINCKSMNTATFYLMNSKIIHTETTSTQAIWINDCKYVNIDKTTVINAMQSSAGLVVQEVDNLGMNHCQFKESFSVPSVVLMLNIVEVVIANCIFSNNIDGQSVITFFQCSDCEALAIVNSTISDNNMTGVTLVNGGVWFNGFNVIHNNNYIEGAGITLPLHAFILVDGELSFCNNSAASHGGAILVVTQPLIKLLPTSSLIYNFECTVIFRNNISSVTFSGNKAGKGGSDLYGAKLMRCNSSYLDAKKNILSVGHPNETTWYFDTPLIEHFHFINADRLSSMSSDPIMVCFCNSSNLPDCSDRTHHMQTYPRLEINTTIATVGYYGGTSPGVVQVSVKNGSLDRHYGQLVTIECFPLRILVKKTVPAQPLVDISVKGGLQGRGVSIVVNVLECPIGFMVDQTTAGQCSCEQFLADNHVQCNVSVTHFQFSRSGNNWFAYINSTRCFTGTTNCPYEYCNPSHVLFDILLPDNQCVGNRAGILCGQCQPNLSIMLGSNHCVLAQTGIFSYCHC